MYDNEKDSVDRLMERYGKLVAILESEKNDLVKCRDKAKKAIREGLSSSAEFVLLRLNNGIGDVRRSSCVQSIFYTTMDYLYSKLDDNNGNEVIKICENVMKSLGSILGAWAVINDNITRLEVGVLNGEDSERKCKEACEKIVTYSVKAIESIECCLREIKI